MVSAAAVALQRPLPHRRPRHRNNLHLSPSPPPTPMCHPPRQCPPPVAERTARQALKTSRWCLAAKAIATAMGSLAKVDSVATGCTSSGAGRRAHALRQAKLAAETPDPVEEQLTLLVVEQLVVKAVFGFAEDGPQALGFQYTGVYFVLRAARMPSRGRGPRAKGKPGPPRRCT